MSAPLRVLIVEDSPDDAALLLRVLRRGGYEPVSKRVDTRADMEAALNEHTWDIVISDHRMPHFSAPAALTVLQESGLDLPFIVVSGVIGEDVAVATMKAGAHDYIMKDNLARLVPAIERELREVAQRRDHRHLEEQLFQFQKMESIGRLAGGVAHDFNNLLTVIQGHAQLGLMSLCQEHYLRANLEEIQKAAERAADLTNRLLAFSRGQISNPRVLSLNDLILNMDKMLRRLIGEDIELVTLVAPDLGLINVDPSQMEQVLVNLAVNARDAMPCGGKLTIETANVALGKDRTRQRTGVPTGEYVMLTVTDNGTGMTEEVKAHLFEPFFTTKEPGKGTGLGLATCYGIVTQSGGHIRVQSEPDQGTTFQVYLPRVKKGIGVGLQHSESRDLPRGKETVLLVEDEPSVRRLAEAVLRQQGYTVLEAANGDEALRLAQEHTEDEIHLLLTDVVMPQMGGRELSDRLRSLRPHTKVLFTSGYANDDVVRRGVRGDGIAFMQKPYTPTALACQVREVLGK